MSEWTLEQEEHENAMNGEMVGLIRWITDVAGADSIPFLDDAVASIVAERDSLHTEVERLRGALGRVDEAAPHWWRMREIARVALTDHQESEHG